LEAAWKELLTAKLAKKGRKVREEELDSF